MSTKVLFYNIYKRVIVNDDDYDKTQETNKMLYRSDSAVHQLVSSDNFLAVLQLRESDEISKVSGSHRQHTTTPPLHHHHTTIILCYPTIIILHQQTIKILHHHPTTIIQHHYTTTKPP